MSKRSEKKCSVVFSRHSIKELEAHTMSFPNPFQGSGKKSILVLCSSITFTVYVIYIYPAKNSSAQVGVRVNSVLTRNDCIKCYISLFKEIIYQQLDGFQTEIQGSLTKLCAFKASRGHPSKVVKLPKMSPGAENMEYLNNP